MYRQFDFHQNPTAVQKTASVCKRFPAQKPSFTPSVLFVETNTSHPRLLPLLRRCRCEKREARSLPQGPAGRHGNRSNTPAVGVGLTAKFVALPCLFPPSVSTLPHPRGVSGAAGEERWEHRAERGWKSRGFSHCFLWLLFPLTSSRSRCLFSGQEDREHVHADSHTTSHGNRIKVWPCFYTTRQFLFQNPRFFSRSCRRRVVWEKKKKLNLVQLLLLQRINSPLHRTIEYTHTVHLGAGLHRESILLWNYLCIYIPYTDGDGIIGENSLFSILSPSFLVQKLN